jgi:hypothetical protein
MATDDLTRVFTTLFTAPTEATVKAAAAQRRIWIDWLRDVKALVDSTADDNVKKAIISEHLALAPTWRMAAKISVGVTMRVASVKRVEGGASLGLGLGTVQVAGNFGFMSQSSSESVLQARAEYSLTNDREISLGDYLTTLGVPIVNANEVDTAIASLSPVPADGD